jgi:hypothetical protein
MMSPRDPKLAKLLLPARAQSPCDRFNALGEPQSLEMTKARDEGRLVDP